MNWPALLGGVLDVLSFYGQGVLFGAGAALGVVIVIAGVRAFGWWSE